MTKQLKPEEIDSIFDKLSNTIDPKAELNFQTKLDLLVAVVLSAQATDKAVNQVTAELWQHCRSAEDYLRFGQERLEQVCRRIGLFRNKTRSILGICEILLRDHDGQVPSQREELMRLPGVGRKTANVVLNVGFGQPVIAVDTHIFRVSNRTGLAKGKTPDQVEEQLMQVVPKKYLLNAHHYLLLHGRYCCTARKPKCDSCIINLECRKIEAL
jgi:endonuclease-3